MQIILADAKIMRSDVKAQPSLTTAPIFLSEATAIAAEMAEKSVPEIAKLFHCSPAIALENHQRFLVFFRWYNAARSVGLLWSGL